MNPPTSPLAYYKLSPLWRCSLPDDEDERKQHLIHVLNSFTTEEWLSLLLQYFNTEDSSCKPTRVREPDECSVVIALLLGAVYPVPIATFEDLEELVKDKRLLIFSRQYYAQAKRVLTSTASNWLNRKTR